MSETLKAIIDKSGGMWAAARFDRTQTPVLIRLSNVGDERVYELWLEQGAAHPFWTIKERPLSDEEAYEVMQAGVNNRAQLSVRLDVGETRYTGFGAAAWIKYGRSDEWLPHVMRARLEATWEPL